MMGTDSVTERLMKMTDEEKARLGAFFEYLLSDDIEADMIWDEIQEMSAAELDEYLISQGVDLQKFHNKTRHILKKLQKEAAS